MSDSNPKYFLRPEAGPVPYEKLQWRARKVLNKIIGTLRTAASDKNRASRIFFVSGEPGSGKSTLYLTLREMLSSQEDNKYSKNYKGDDEDRMALDALRAKGAIRWLETLDLEVAGDEGENLLAAVLVRVIEVLTKTNSVSNTVLSNQCEGAIKDLEELATDIGIAWEGNLQDRAGELDPDTYSEEVMRTQRARLRVNERLKEALDKLAENECYGCRKETLFVLPVDDFYLKPDASLQLLRLLRMISIPRLFFLVMGDIKTIEALFVEKSLADWTAVAGDRIFAARTDRLDDALSRARELRARYLRKLLPPGQRAEIEAMDWDEALDFNPEQLDAKDTLEKLLENRPLDRPWDEADNDTSPEPTGNDRAISKDDIGSLLTFLLCPSFSKEERDKKEEEKKNRERGVTGTEPSTEEVAQQKSARKAREAYTALQILDATSREIMDLWFAFYELDNQAKSKNPSKDDARLLLQLVLDFVKIEMEEQSFLNENQQEALLGVLPTRHYTAQEIYLDMNHLSLEPEQNTWSEQKNEKQGSSGQPEQRLWVRKHRSWKLEVNTDKDESNEIEGLFKKLPPRQAAWMVLLHDLTWKWNPERVTGNLVEKVCGTLNNSPLSESKARSLSKRDDNTEVTKLNVQQLIKLLAIWRNNDLSVEDREHNSSNDIDPIKDFRGWAVWQEKPERSEKLEFHHFPMPDFNTFRDMDRFLHVWSTGVEWFDNLQKEAEDAAKRFEAAFNRAERAKPQTQVVAPQQPTQGDEVQKITKNDMSERLANEAKEAERVANEAQGRVGNDTSQKAHIFLSLWALAGWTIHVNAYKNFAKSKDDWYEKFDVTKDDPFEKRFAAFKRTLEDFEYPEDDTQIEDWLRILKEWPDKNKPFINKLSSSKSGGRPKDN